MFAEQNPHQSYDELLQHLRLVSLFFSCFLPYRARCWISESIQTHPHTWIRAEGTNLRDAPCGTSIHSRGCFRVLIAEFLTCDCALICRIWSGNLRYKQCYEYGWEDVVYIIGSEYLVLVLRWIPVLSTVLPCVNPLYVGYLMIEAQIYYPFTSQIV